MAFRLSRALLLFGAIFASYLVQMGLARLLGRQVHDAEENRTRWRVPEWVRRRRKKVDQKNARRLLRGMLRLRGVYIKLGQVLSIMGGFLPRAFTVELESLQDQVPPHPFKDVERTFQQCFGKSPEQCFKDIDRTPIAAASLGQVHAAHLADGTKVAVKILYPRIRDVIKTDMRVLRYVLVVYKWFFPFNHLERVHASLVDLLRRETDYLHEAACMERMAKNFSAEPDILFPEVVHELTTKEILTMTYMEGIKITRFDELEKLGVDRTRLATRLVQSFYKQLFVDRFFHADPHPGNFLVQEGPKIVVLDFGAVSEVGEVVIDGALDVLQAIMTNDKALALKGFRQMGFVSEEGNKELLEQTAMTYFGKLLKLEKRTPDALMKADRKSLQRLVDPEVERQELRDLMRSFTYPEGWFYVERASVLAFWLCGQIDPNLDTMMIGVPYVMPLVMAKQMAKQMAAAV